MAILRIPTPLRSYTEGAVEVRVGGATVGEALESLVVQHPALRAHLFSSDGNLRPFVNLFVGEQNVKDLSGLATAVSEETRILLVPSIAGG